MVLNQLIAIAVLRSARNISIGKDVLADKLFRYEKSEFWEQIQALCSAVWDQATEILSPRFKPPTSDVQTESLRKRIASESVAGHRTRETLEAELIEDFVRNRQAVKDLVDQCESMYPKDFLIITDGRSSLDDKNLLDLFASSLKRIEQHKKPV